MFNHPVMEKLLEVKWERFGYGCMHVYVYVCMYVCSSKEAFGGQMGEIRVWMCACICVRMYVCMYVCMYHPVMEKLLEVTWERFGYGCVHVYVYVCMYVCIFDICMYLRYFTDIIVIVIVHRRNCN